MSAPNLYLPGTYYEVTRRCVERAHKLTPDYPMPGPHRSSVEQMYKYATAMFAEDLGISVIAVCVMSNHIHEILFDRFGRIAEFIQKRNAMLANMVKVRYALPGSIFDRRTEKYNRLLGPRAIATKIAYVIANPVAAGLVASPEEWPGYVSHIEDLRGVAEVVRRPGEYLSQNDERYPKRLTYSVGAPTELEALFGAISSLIAEIRPLLEGNIKRARRRHAGAFAGSKRVLRTSPHHRAMTKEPLRSHVPRFTAAGDKDAAQRFLRELRAFWRAHRAALEAIRLGVRVVLFPPGTGKMHFTYGFPRESILRPYAA